jgi:hypothetical protein
MALGDEAAAIEGRLRRHLRGVFHWLVCGLVVLGRAEWVPLPTPNGVVGFCIFRTNSACWAGGKTYVHVSIEQCDK